MVERIRDQVPLQDYTEPNWSKDLTEQGVIHVLPVEDEAKRDVP